jgi:hypothetical protein
LPELLVERLTRELRVASETSEVDRFLGESGGFGYWFVIEDHYIRAIATISPMKVGEVPTGRLFRR